MSSTGIRSCSLLIFFLFLSSCAQRAVLSNPRNPELTSGDLDQAVSSQAWLTYGHSYDNQRFAPAGDITTRNVARLVPKFIVQTGEAAPLEGSPLFSDGVVYTIGWNDHVIAFDGSNGTLLWEYKPHLRLGILCCGAVSRGVALADGMVFVAQLDDQLVALDQFTGKPQWNVRIADPSSGYSVTMAPVVYRDSVLVGVAGGDWGVRGFLSAYSIADGAKRWTWYATDRRHWRGKFVTKDVCGHNLHRDIPEEQRLQARYSEAWKRGGGAVWTTPAIDSQRAEIYLTTGNPWPDYAPQVRPGDNLFTDSIVALRADTGHLDWYVQEVPHDQWDWDPASPPVLFEARRHDGQTIPIVAEAGKTGWVYELDRNKGTLVRCSSAFVPQRNMFSRTARQDVSPGASGGANWSPAAFDPRLDLLVIMGTARAIRHPLGTQRADYEETDNYSTLTAINVDDGSIRWQRMLPSGSIGGAATTQGDLTFFGDSRGYLNAVATDTGQQLWRFQTGAAVNAPPVVYVDEGSELVLVASGGNARMGTRLGDTFVAFGLP
jgi:alcohol dehydrogenase (cytochrome c)